MSKRRRRVIDPLDNSDSVEVLDQVDGSPEPEVEAPQIPEEVEAPQLPDAESLPLPTVEWVTIRLPVVRDFDRKAYVPAAVTADMGLRHQREATRALFEGMQAAHCCVQMRSAIGHRGAPVAKWHHPVLYVMDQVAKELQSVPESPGNQGA